MQITQGAEYSMLKTYKKLPGSHGVTLTLNYKPSDKNRSITQSRVITNINNLKVGKTYLYLIEAVKKETKEPNNKITTHISFNTRFLESKGTVEYTERHAFFANISNWHHRVIVAAGEITRTPTDYEFNLESGTFMKPLIKRYTNFGRTEPEKFFKSFVKSVFGVGHYTNKVLVVNTNKPMNILTAIKEAEKYPGSIKIANPYPGGRRGKRMGVPDLNTATWVKSALRGSRSRGPANPQFQLGTPTKRKREQSPPPSPAAKRPKLPPNRIKNIQKLIDRLLSQVPRR